MKEKKVLVISEKEETVYECPSCHHLFAALTVIDGVGWKQIPSFCIYCGAKMEKT